MLTPSEKTAIRKEWDIIISEKLTIEAQADAYSITTEKDTYTRALVSTTVSEGLANYLNNNSLWVYSLISPPTWINDANLSSNTSIVGVDFRNKFKAYYEARTLLLKKISDTALTIANSKLPASSDLAAIINTGTTTIDGGIITADSVTANKIAVNAITGKTITGGHIYGTAIEGVNIVGSVIKSSWIDYSSVGALTNWKYYTPVTVPLAYEANFAHDSLSGNIIVDSQGYVRLPTTSGATSTYVTYSAYAEGGGALSAWSIPNMLAGLHSYSSYQINTTKRFISIRPTFEVINLSDYILDLSIVGGTN